ncbi:SDR family NAD(P)-dependent oxidoreductase [Marinibactrum halimedae]|uniref:Short-chain dehydrogenase n=1 Tax=Marinibactrum halimedae TaxID=1444977 RepID=A0AA37T8G2_9GAMM|nr:SDR family NAD(P)-dependent oxidoreductase [Marinibactrum halimedae]MCD9460893.1 SDR family NAD(P)-dependent oxidoreductase [Marinibactrum halimedae]GLS24567.1 short-chain dehydrogenase [Marinibactrum halimedae]
MTFSALIIGANSAIAKALINQLLQGNQPLTEDSTGRHITEIISISRTDNEPLLHSPVIHRRLQVQDYSEASITEVINQINTESTCLRMVFICNGILHDGNLQPEKNIGQLSEFALQRVFTVNTVTPTLWLKHLFPVFDRQKKQHGNTPCHVVVFSARIGSIGDNELGGWYSYRASKAALNMVLKTMAIEFRRRIPNVKLIAFHPGTTDTPLSKPFQKSVSKEKLFSPEFVATQLLKIIDETPVDGELSYLDWDNKPIIW